MERLDLTTPNFTDENIQKLSELFPNCVTEDSNGKTIDFDTLKQELSSNIVEGNQERYQLTWPGKAESLVIANTPINKTLRPCREESKDFDNTENLYIEGDNLEVLKLLQETYLGKIKMIYIDPPYNTGKDFVYKDNFTQDKAEYDEESGNVNDEGGRLVSNPDSNGRYHSDWLSMLYPRLKLARNLLKDDGVIFVSIDDTEVGNLRKICDEVFGEVNFFADMVVVRSEGGGLAKKVIKGHDNLLVYVKSLDNFNGIWRPKDIRGKIIEKDGREFWIEEDWLRKEFGKYGTCLYEEIEILKGKQKKEEIDKGLLDGKYRLIEKKGGHIVGRLRALDEDGSKFYSVLKHLNKNGIKDLESINASGLFDFPKPVSLIKELILGGSLFSKKESDIALDFFSGSATTAHAVMALNAEDNGNRKFIMVQIPEATDEKTEAYKASYKTIAEIGKERIRRAGEKIKTDNADKEGINDLDIGFRVLKVDSSNIEDVHLSPDNTKQNDILNLFRNIKEGRTDEDLLFMVLLDWGIDLSVKIERREVAGKVVYFADDNFLAACFEKNIDEDFVRTLVGNNPLKVVLQDNGFANDSVKINAEQIFKQADIEVKVI